MGQNTSCERTGWVLKNISRKGSRGLGAQQLVHESAVCPFSSKNELQPGCVCKSANRCKGYDCSAPFMLVRPPLGCCFQSGPPQYKTNLIYWRKSSGGQQCDGSAAHTTCKERLRQLCLFSLAKGRVWGSSAP